MDLLESERLLFSALLIWCWASGNPVILLENWPRSPQVSCCEVGPSSERPPGDAQNRQMGKERQTGKERHKERKNEVDGKLWPVFVQPQQPSGDHTLSGIPAAKIFHGMFLKE